MEERPSIIKSQLDKRDYRVITLSNQVKAVLISDKETDKVLIDLIYHRN